MMSEKEFISGVWEKYLSYQENTFKDKFFRINIKKEIPSRIMKIAAMFLLSISIVGGGGIAGYKYFIEPRISQTFTENFEYLENMSFDKDNVYYKIVTSYEEYLEVKNDLDNITSMTKEDFENNFMIIVATPTERTHEIYIKDIRADENTLYIECSRESAKKIKNIVTTTASKELLRENVDVIMFYENIKKSGYVDLDKLPSNYTKEEAVKDNCFVVASETIISEDKEQIDRFITETENNKKDNMIRIYVSQTNSYITDIVYKSGIYFVYQRSIGTNYVSSTTASRIRKYTIFEGTINERIVYGYKRGNVEWEDGFQSMYWTLCNIKK